MKYQTIEGLNKKVSKIIFGTAAKEFIEGQNQNELLDAVFKMGINTFDTARNYGLSEQTLGLWLKNSTKRDEIIIASKCGHPDVDTGRDRINAKEINEDLNESLSLLNTDYLDLYLLHRDDPKMPAEEIIELMNETITSGKVLAIGVSNWSHERIKQANDYALTHHLKPFIVSSPNYSLAKNVVNPWLGECVSLSGEEMLSERINYINNQMPIFAYSSLGRGLFSGAVNTNDLNSITKLDEFAKTSFYHQENMQILKRCEELAHEKNVSISNIALAWLFKNPMNIFPIISTRKIERMLDNINSFDIELSNEEYKYLKDE